MTEEWRPIAETNGKYEVSNMGRIRFTKTGRIRKGKILPSGYLHFSFKMGSKRMYRYIHRLVADAFCDHPEGCNVINHLDNNTKNNRADNLEWTTQRRNVLYAMEQGRVQNFPNAKKVIAIKDGVETIFNSANEAASVLGCSPSWVTKCLKGKRKTIYGYRWKYAEVSA